MERKTIIDFYAMDIEADRLETDLFKLEGIRTKEIIDRYIQRSNLEILDVGGGAGFYSFWLKEKGHNVTLVDLSPRNIELVKQYSEAKGIALNKIENGDAVNLSFPNEQFDLVLLLGPLYHLVDRAERIMALSEAKRVLKTGGLLIAAVISRYASLFDGFQRDWIYDSQFFKLLKNDLNTGIHLNESGYSQYFTTAYFHNTNEIEPEITEAGLRFEKLIAVESFGWILTYPFDKINDPVYLERMLEAIRMVETKDDLMAMSPHIIAIAKKE